VLKAIYPTLITQFKKEWCKKRVYLPFDFCIPEFKIIIELDGRQHFTQVSNWASPEETFKTDLFKEKCANDNGYSVIRILQEDVFNDTYDWKKELYETIEELINGDEIANVYLCKNGEYDKF
jgi:very-short-patch-repair endonuclease